MNVEAIRIALAAAIAAVFTVLLAINLVGGDESVDEHPGIERNAVMLSESELLGRAGTLEHPAYWLGGHPGIEKYELETTSTGGTYIRYLDGDSTAADAPPDILTMATYPVADARQALARAARTATDDQALSRHAGFVTLSGRGTDNAYVVFDDQPELQVEVYSPRRGEAAKLATAGAPVPLP